MRRKQQFAIVWMLVVAMTFSPAMVYSQPPAVVASAAPQKQKLDLGYVTPETVAVVSLYPRSVLAAPEMELLPIEVLSAAGQKELGIDPVQIEQVLAIAEPPTASPPQVGVVLHFVSPLGQGKLLAPLWEQTTEAQLDGKPYRRAKSPMDASIFQPDPQTLIVAHDGLLQKMVANHARPQEGKMSQMLKGVRDAPDVLAVVQIEPLRPLIAGALKLEAIPPPLAGLANVLNLVSYVAAKANLTGDQAMMLTIRANDEAAAKQLEEIIDGLMALGQQAMLAEIAKQEASSDPVEQAMAKYAKRVSQRMMKMLRPVRDGASLNLAGNARGGNAQIATIGLLIGLLLPAVQAAREAGRRVQSSNNLKQIGMAVLMHQNAKRTFPARANFDKQGKPLLSWRVHMLPYLEQQALYQQFHQDEPWDSDHNKQLIPLMPKIYQNPSVPPRPGMANYLGVSGEGLMFEGSKARTFADIMDGLSHTIMVVEADDERAVVWTKPDDWEFNAAKPLSGLGRAHAGGFNALFADGSVHFIANAIAPATFKALLTIAGHEVLGDY